MHTRPNASQRALIFRCAAVAAATLGVDRVAAADPFYMGSDISLLSFFQQQGVTYKSNGQALPADQILYDAGDNLFRLRIFVNPNTSYSATEGAIQNTAYDIALAQQLKADDPGAQLLLDFHYADSWADPGKQPTPVEWGGSTASLASLETNIYNNTFNTLEAFQAAGVMPGMVQLGNEINSGLDWNTGMINFSGGTKENQSWANLGALLNQGISAVRAVQGTGPKIQIAIHIANGAMNGEPQFFFNDLQTLGHVTDYDIEGVSFYPGNGNGATLSLLQSNLTALANTYPTKKIMVLETNYPYENFSGNPYTGYANTTSGQEQEISQVAGVIQNLPHNAGEGIVYWDAEGIQIPGFSVYNGGATALFDSSGNALPAQAAFGITMANQSWSPTNGASWSGGENWSNGVVPRQAGDAVTFGAGAGGLVTLDASWTVGSVTFNNSNSYTLAGGTGGTLVLDNGGVTATAAITNSGGTHTISAPVHLNSNLQITVGIAGDELTISGNITGTGGVSTGGAGTVVLGGVNTYAGPTVVNGGSLVIAGQIGGAVTVGTTPGAAALLYIAPGSGADTLSAVTVNAGSTLDITNNKLIINYGSGADPVSAIAAALALGYNNGTWSGGGITSSTAAANGRFAVGYLDGNQPSDTTAATVLSNQLILKYTLAGDAFLENTVGFDDLVVVAQNFGATGKDWAGGNFTYDPAGSVGFADLVSVAQNFGFSSGMNEGVSGGGGVSLAWLDQTAAAVPEPVSTMLFAALAVGWMGQRRRRIKAGAHSAPAAGGSRLER